MRAGARADFVLLESDPREVDPMGISEIDVAATWRDGDQVFAVNG